MLFLKLSTNELIVLLCTIPMFLIIFVIALIALIKRIKMAKLYKKEKSNDNIELQETLLSALGGKENIISVNVEMSRLTITLKDIDVINPDVLKKSGANGVLLVGNMVKCSFGEKAEIIANLLR